MTKTAAILVVLASLLSQSASAQSSQRVKLPSGVILKNVSLSWEGRRLIFHALFNQYGHEMPIFLRWNPAKGQGGITEVDTIEQFGRDLPLEVTVISLEKNPAGQAIVYMGHPSNAPRQAGNDPLNLTVHLIMTNDDVGSTDEYSFTLSPDGDGLPRIAASK